MYVLTTCISYMTLYPSIPMAEWCLIQAEWNPLSNRQGFTVQGPACTAKQAVTPPRQHPGPPATVLVGRAGPTLATAAPFLQHLQSPLPIWRVILLYRGLLSLSAWERSCSIGLCTPRDPSTLQETLLGAARSLGLLPMEENDCSHLAAWVFLWMQQCS